MKYKFAGISTVFSADGDKAPHFHVTKIENKPIGVWFVPPGRAEFQYIKLPEPMEKIDAMKHLLGHTDFQSKFFQGFLKSEIDKKEPKTKEASSKKKKDAVAKLKDTATAPKKKAASKKKSTAKQTGVTAASTEHTPSNEPAPDIENVDLDLPADEKAAH